MKIDELFWKTIPQNFESRGHKWEIGTWYHVNGTIKLCIRGFHASPTIIGAMSFVTPGWVCRVNVKGESATDSDKSAWSDMMIVSRCKWTKKMSVELAIYAAELVLPIYEKEYPDDKRPRNAIEAAKAYLRKPSAAYAAYAAHAAYAADAAAHAADAAYAAAHAAAHAAASAAHAAHDAHAAAYAAASAAHAAHAAAYAAHAAHDAHATLKKIERKIKQLAGITT
ncbi:MAG: hypothetical protein KKC03_13945 [Bacteroidetes bacterium]|nr:hypothetical protein [Bacteroidota bacterium]